MGPDTPRAQPPSDEGLVHRITQAEGQGSPGGFARPGRAIALDHHPPTLAQPREEEA
jgi:hypothetical protein